MRPGNNIDLATTGPEIERGNAIPFLLQVFCGNGFAAAADVESRFYRGER